MSILVIDEQVVHYEVFGRGQPVLFLHGWLGSWRYWYPTIEAVAKRFRTYSFDFWGFGDSRRTNVGESIQNYSHQVIRFLDEMGIDRILLVGHSMGGMVALKTAIDYPNRVRRVVTVGAPIQGNSLSWLLKLTGNSFLANVFAHWHWLRINLFHFFLGEAQDPAVHEIIEDSLKSNADTLQLTVRSMLHTDLSLELRNLFVPSLVIHGGLDDIVNAHQADLFDHISCAEIALMPNSRHFPFLDEPDLFNDLLLRFLITSSPPSLAIPSSQHTPVA